MSDLCADPACAQIREWYLADEVKLAKIRSLPRHRINPDADDFVMAEDIDRILDGEPQP